MRQLPLPVQLRASSIFENFYRGPNAAVVEQLLALRQESKRRVMWLHGAPGVGKTHLLQAVCSEAGKNRLAAAYLPLASVELNPDVLMGCDSLSFVCLDDFERIAGQSNWERAVFRLYTELEDSGGQLLVAAQSPPGGIGIALKDLASRLAAGAILRLRSLSDEEQCEALAFRATRLGLELPTDVARYLLRRLPRDMNTLCAALDELDSASLATQRKLTLPFVRATLGERSIH